MLSTSYLEDFSSKEWWEVRPKKDPLKFMKSVVDRKKTHNKLLTDGPEGLGQGERACLQENIISRHSILRICSTK